MSVREFAEFRLGPRESAPGTNLAWRAQLGSELHRQLQNEPDAQEAGVSFEEVISGVMVFGDWQCELQGRIDKWIQTEDQLRLVEFKTVRASLPLDPEDIYQRYPEYAGQLAAYLMLVSLNPRWNEVELTGDLLLQNIDDGFRQTVSMSIDEARERVDARAAVLLPFLESRWQHTSRLRRLEFRPAHEVPREGQTDTLGELREACIRSPITLFQAPTGFGKTGLALEHALEQLRDGAVSRIIYLSSKSTGQLQVVRQLQRMLVSKNKDTAPAYYQLRNKAEHAARCPLTHCDARRSCLRGIEERWAAADIRPWELFGEASPGLDEIIRLSAEKQVCPFELSKVLLAFADIWICDYNYVFSPGVTGVFEGVSGYDPGQTLLIVDEAHNLAPRVADVYSFSDTQSFIDAMLFELQKAGATARVARAVECWHEFLDGLKPTARHDTNTEYEAADLLTSMADARSESQLDYEALPPWAADRRFELAGRARWLESAQFPRLCWSQKAGELRVTTLDAGPAIASALNSFANALLMSATLEPMPGTIEKFGLMKQPPAVVDAAAPWRAVAYDVAVDTRVDTRFKRRGEFYAETARTLASFAGGGTVAAFFSSYAYAETVRTYLEAEAPGLIISMQPRVNDLGGQMRFVEESLLVAHVLCFVLGSSFSESIDHLGGQVERAMVIGPALPEVNAEQKARMEALSHLERSEAFREVYIVPAMGKINQALGRLVRAPGQRARVLLHGLRFAEPDYQSLLMQEYRNGKIITNDKDLGEWLG